VSDTTSAYIIYLQGVA